MANPTISELQNPDDYELIAQLEHHQLKDFVLEQLADGGKLVKSYMYYQLLMVLFGVFFILRAAVMAFQSAPQAFYWALGSLIFCFSVLIALHELLHGIALKLVGAKNIHYGGYLKKFIFYAEADRFVLNRKQFTLIALTPLIIIKTISLFGIIAFFGHPAANFFIVLMSAHSLFCAGDIGLLSLFYKNKNDRIFTYDVKSEKKSYYYQKGK